jgi:hypothetical protein
VNETIWFHHAQDDVPKVALIDDFGLLWIRGAECDLPKDRVQTEWVRAVQSLVAAPLVGHTRTLWVGLAEGAELARLRRIEKWALEVVKYPRCNLTYAMQQLREACVPLARCPECHASMPDLYANLVAHVCGQPEAR